MASPYQVCGPSPSSVGTVWSCGLLTLPYWHGFNPGVHVDLTLKLVSLFVYGSLRRQRVDTGCGWTLPIRRSFVSFPQMIPLYPKTWCQRAFTHSLVYSGNFYHTCPFAATSFKRNKTGSWEKKVTVWGLPEMQEESTMMVMCPRCWGYTGVVSLTWHRWPGSQNMQKGRCRQYSFTPDSSYCKWKKCVPSYLVSELWKFCKPWEKRHLSNAMPKHHFNGCTRLLYGNVSWFIYRLPYGNQPTWFTQEGEGEVVPGTWVLNLGSPRKTGRVGCPVFSCIFRLFPVFTNRNNTVEHFGA